jgi:predicted nucleic acid-binding Zn ribbon protein
VRLTSYEIGLGLLFIVVTAVLPADQAECSERVQEVFKCERVQTQLLTYSFGRFRPLA